MKHILIGFIAISLSLVISMSSETHAGTISAQRSTGRYMSSLFWKDNPSNQDIVRALHNYTDFSGSRSTPCSGVTNVQYINPTDTITNSSFSSNTIYVFKQGDHTMPNPWTLSDISCVAFVGKGSSRLNIGSSGLLFSGDTDYLLFDGLSVLHTGSNSNNQVYTQHIGMNRIRMLFSNIFGLFNNNISFYGNSIIRNSIIKTEGGIVFGNYSHTTILSNNIFFLNNSIYFPIGSIREIQDSLFFNSETAGIGMSYVTGYAYNSLFANNPYGVYVSQSNGMSFQNIGMINNGVRFQIEQLGTNGEGVATFSGSLGIDENNGIDNWLVEDPYPAPTIYNLYSPGSERPIRNTAINNCDYLAIPVDRPDISNDCRTQGPLYTYNFSPTTPFLFGSALPTQTTNTQYSGQKIGRHEGINDGWILFNCFDVSAQYPDSGGEFPAFCYQGGLSGIVRGLSIGSIITYPINYINTTPDILTGNTINYLGKWPVFPDPEGYQTGTTSVYVKTFKSLEGQWEIE